MVGGLMSFLVVDRLSKRFETTLAVHEVSLSLTRGQILALLGPSGSGKTTTLRLLAGFETPDTGRIVVDGEDVTATGPAARRFGMVFQHYALFPHLDVGANVGFGLESLGVRGRDLEARVTEALRLVDLAGLEGRRPTQLSGGQQQRVALARALAPEPRVLLLDEPLSNLDPTLRERTRREIRSLIRRLGITTVIVTHEQEEAFDLGDLVAVMRQGRVEQVGTPEQLYSAPVNPFVASFVGRASMLEGSAVESDGITTRVRVGEAIWTIPTPPSGPLKGAVLLMVRPEGFRLMAPAPQLVTGTVAERRFIGAEALYTVRLPKGAEIEVSGEPFAAKPGDSVGLQPTGRGIFLFAGGGR
jgi:ABC-type Fe3+/spermidine/putrescine transport system ATPase subunit